MAEAIFLTCFLLVAYANVANDSIQTIGPFLAANRATAWWLLWLFIGALLTVGMTIGWWANSGDPSFGRLERFGDHGAVPWSWIHVIPPLALLVLTWLGYPVSATFLILGVFRPENLLGMVQKSLLGYGLAFVLGFVIYRFVMVRWEALWQAHAERAGRKWVVLQWLATAWLYTNWFRQDMATQFVYLPRPLDAGTFALALGYLVLVMGIVIFGRGGRIQRIVDEKQNVDDPRSATVVSFLYGTVFFALLEYSNLPMSSTWVFVGMLAGREFGIRVLAGRAGVREAAIRSGRDLYKAGAALLVSVVVVLLFGLGASRP